MAEEKYKIEDITNTILQGNCLSVLRKIPDESVDLICTSPPYWSQRDYKSSAEIWGGDPNCKHKWGNDIKKVSTASTKENAGTSFTSTSNVCVKCSAYKGELGHEPTPELFVEHLASIFIEAKRVLKKEGSLFINIDDTYDKNKCVSMVPEKLAIKLIENGFILRNKIIWQKLNSMPESITDRFSTSYEMVYFFAKSSKYYFEQLTEPLQQVSIDRAKYPSVSPRNEAGIQGGITNEGQQKTFEKILSGEITERNMRDVWTVNTAGLRGVTHYAVFPQKLAVRPIDACCPLEVCIKCNKPRQKLIRSEYKGDSLKNGAKSAGGGVHNIPRDVAKKEFLGYSDCKCGAGFKPGIVLDPFFGMGTTGLVARKRGRNYIGIEINPEFAKLAQDRLFRDLGLFGDSSEITD